MKKILTIAFSFVSFGAFANSDIPFVKAERWVIGTSCATYELSVDCSTFSSRSDCVSYMENLAMSLEWLCEQGDPE